MPVYEFACDKCEVLKEVDRPMSQSGQEVICSCGIPMRRIFSPINFQMPETGRERVFATLNQEEGAGDFPGGDMHRKRYEEAMVKGVDGSQRTSQFGQFRPIGGSRA